MPWLQPRVTVESPEAPGLTVLKPCGNKKGTDAASESSGGQFDKRGYRGVNWGI